ncbi:hypothetical protein [Thalassiella azotivora]
MRDADGGPGVLGRVTVPALAAALAGALAWVAGADVGHAVLVAVAVLLVVATARALGGGSQGTWPPAPEDTSGTGCHLVQLQARALTECERDGDRFERVVAPRLRVLATGRLRAAGHDPASPATRDLLGADLYDALRPGRAPRRPGQVVQRLLDRLDEIDPPRPVGRGRATDVVPRTTSGAQTPTAVPPLREDLHG